VIREHAGNQARPKTERSSLSTQTRSDSIGLNQLNGGARDRDTRARRQSSSSEDRALITQTQSDSVRLNRTQSDAINSTVVLVIVIREHAGNQARPKTEPSSLSTQTRSDSVRLNRTQSDAVRRSRNRLRRGRRVVAVEGVRERSGGRAASVEPSYLWGEGAP